MFQLTILIQPIITFEILIKIHYYNILVYNYSKQRWLLTE